MSSNTSTTTLPSAPRDGVATGKPRFTLLPTGGDAAAAGAYCGPDGCHPAGADPAPPAASTLAEPAAPKTSHAGRR